MESERHDGRRPVASTLLSGGWTFQFPLGALRHNRLYMLLSRILPATFLVSLLVAGPAGASPPRIASGEGRIQAVLHRCGEDKYRYITTHNITVRTVGNFRSVKVNGPYMDGGHLRFTLNKVKPNSWAYRATRAGKCFAPKHKRPSRDFKVAMKAIGTHRKGKDRKDIRVRISW